MRTALFVTCFNDTLFPDTGRAVVTLLERLGCEVEFPLEQTCCGQMHVNSGYEHEARGLMQRFARVFGAEVVVSPSASCVAHVRERIPGVRAYELTEFLVDQLGVVDVGASFPHRVVLHPTCHSLRLLRVGDRPRRLARAVRGIDLVIWRPRSAAGSAVRSRSRTLTRRWRCCRQAAPRPRHPRRGVHGGGHVVFDAHRRRVARQRRRTLHLA
jgi:Fe-S oxidoreductase